MLIERTGGFVRSLVPVNETGSDSYGRGRVQEGVQGPAPSAELSSRNSLPPATFGGSEEAS
jgi:hypothetical protein